MKQFDKRHQMKTKFPCFPAAPAPQRGLCFSEVQLLHPQQSDCAEMASLLLVSAESSPITSVTIAFIFICSPELLSHVPLLLSLTRLLGDAGSLGPLAKQGLGAACITADQLPAHLLQVDLL